MAVTRPPARRAARSCRRARRRDRPRSCPPRGREASPAAPPPRPAPTRRLRDSREDPRWRRPQRGAAFRWAGSRPRVSPPSASGSHLTERSSGASLRCASAICRAIVLAIALRPARPQPIGRVEPRRILFFDQARAFARQTAQHGVDQALERRMAGGFGQIDRRRHRGMGRGFEEQQLRERPGAACRAPPRRARAEAWPGNAPSGRRSGRGGASSSPPAAGRRRGRAAPTRPRACSRPEPGRAGFSARAPPPAMRARCRGPSGERPGRHS